MRAGGRVARFRGELQARAHERRAGRAGDGRPGRVPAVAYRDVDELDGFVDALAGEVRQAGFRALLTRLLGDDELRAALRTLARARAASTTPISAGCSSTRSPSRRSRSRRARCTSAWTRTCCSRAALLHDLGRTRELTLGAEVGLSDEGRLLGHVELGLRMIEEARPQTGLDDARRLALGHCVLAHHGADALPGRRFALPEALALYRLNALDAAIKAAIEHGMGHDAPAP